ncbi:unnamed protein product [Microthlaspi erraticum]|uniref:Retrotransposon gag domain-containing protein n=1 Tax=Microthlaspi erraticum TaxID=1685480 RepID=A0A6D2L8H2_9BRAS|nr:unnamed protein product [Microthlaspi erraticum]
MSSQTRINELQASRFPPEHLRTPGPPLPTQRTLFGENPYATNRHDRHSGPSCANTISYSLENAEWNGHEYEIRRMQSQLQNMNSRIHQATSSAPEIDQVLREAQNTPFTDRIGHAPVHHPGKLKIPPYEGNTDPRQYLTAFCIAMGRTHFSEEERDAGFCQLFVENLSGSALTWFSRLESRSIDSYHQLTTAFLKQYSMYIRRGAPAPTCGHSAKGQRTPCENSSTSSKA